MSNTQLFINQLQDISTRGSLSTVYKPICRHACFWCVGCESICKMSIDVCAIMFCSCGIWYLCQTTSRSQTGTQILNKAYCYVYMGDCLKCVEWESTLICTYVKSQWMFMLLHCLVQSFLFLIAHYTLQSFVVRLLGNTSPQ